MTSEGGVHGSPLPDSIQVRYGGCSYERDLAKCRLVLTERRIAGPHRSVREFAGSVGLSLATVNAWLNGAKAGTRETTDRILAGLDLSFEEVHRAVGS